MCLPAGSVYARRALEWSGSPPRAPLREAHHSTVVPPHLMSSHNNRAMRLNALWAASRSRPQPAGVTICVRAVGRNGNRRQAPPPPSVRSQPESC
jgi:hypothetical protein